MTRKAVKGSIIADHLADHAMEDYESLDFEFPDEDVLAIEEEKSDWWIMYFVTTRLSKPKTIVNFFFYMYI